jgi:hypothetical protein
MDRWLARAQVRAWVPARETAPARVLGTGQGLGRALVKARVPAQGWGPA